VSNWSQANVRLFSLLIACKRLVSSTLEAYKVRNWLQTNVALKCNLYRYSPGSSRGATWTMLRLEAMLYKLNPVLDPKLERRL
jgi:hypothetical protein